MPTNAPEHNSGAETPATPGSPRSDQSVSRRLVWRWAAIWLTLLGAPILSFAIVGEEAFTNLLSQFRQPAAAGIICASLLLLDVLLPVPSSFVAVVSGQSLGFWLGAALNWVFICGGHLIGFILARRYGRNWVTRFVGEAAMRRADRVWRSGSVSALLLSRPVPVLAESLSMWAGLSDMPLRRFLQVIALGNLPHSFIYSWGGARLAGGASLNALIAVGVGVPTAAYLIATAWRSRSAG